MPSLDVSPRVGDTCVLWDAGLGFNQSFVEAKDDKPSTLCTPRPHSLRHRDRHCPPAPRERNQVVFHLGSLTTPTRDSSLPPFTLWVKEARKTSTLKQTFQTILG